MNGFSPHILFGMGYYYEFDHGGGAHKSFVQIESPSRFNILVIRLCLLTVLKSNKNNKNKNKNRIVFA